MAAAGGDGTAHEVLNGLMSAGRPDVHFSIIPIGSANDYAHSLGLDSADGRPTAARPVDVGRVRSPDGRLQYFGCNLGMGLNGAVTLESRRIRRLQGMALYGLATVRALVYHFRSPHMTLRIDDAPPWQSRTLLFSVLVGRREGGFVLAPCAEVDDGCLDYIHAADLSRWQVLQLLPRIALFVRRRCIPRCARAAAAAYCCNPRHRCSCTPTASSSACRRTMSASWRSICCRGR